MRQNIERILGWDKTLPLLLLGLTTTGFWKIG